MTTPKTSPSDEADGFPDDADTPLIDEAAPDGAKSPSPDSDPAEAENGPENGSETPDPAWVARQLRKYIVKLSSRITHTGLRTLMDDYLRVIHPGRAQDAETALPRSVRLHPAGLDRCQVGQHGDLICHYIGLAVLSYYALCRDEECEHALDRIAYVRDLALWGPAEFVVVGTESTGYMLLTRQAVADNAAGEEDEL